jgi:heme-degrading monooxygenase HmoA
MFAVIFEVTPKPERRQDYLRHAGLLRPDLEKIDGFIANERFASLRCEGWVLSLSIWRNEKAVIRWRTLARHHETQEKGRFEIFADYHLRVGEITADTGRPTDEMLRQERFDETETGAAKFAVITERPIVGMPEHPELADMVIRLGAPALGRTDGLVAWDGFSQLGERDLFLLLTSWRDAGAADLWLATQSDNGGRHRRVRIIRDYGMFDRREAPQYFPPVAPGQATSAA